ncbi:IclR family transcriptional regulator C-terminal domain-containing protein [Streptomyces sp. NPDC048516]|uniref:IclR family transcriptional regulator domain-containing protein n=1 Tax=Streptomyces sp. NPDC048516 TaxID=3365565 RepID=UPI003717CB90
MESWAGFRVTTLGRAIGQYPLAWFDGASSGERPAHRAVQSISTFSVPSVDELLHPADTVRGNHRAFTYREYALGTACAALPAQVEAAVSVPADSPSADELHRLRSVTDRLRKMAESALTTLAFSVSI